MIKMARDTLVEMLIRMVLSVFGYSGSPASLVDPIVVGGSGSLWAGTARLSALIRPPSFSPHQKKKMPVKQLCSSFPTENIFFMSVVCVITTFDRGTSLPVPYFDLLIFPSRNVSWNNDALGGRIMAMLADDQAVTYKRAAQLNSFRLTIRLEGFGVACCARALHIGLHISLKHDSGTNACGWPLSLQM